MVVNEVCKYYYDSNIQRFILTDRDGAPIDKRAVSLLDVNLLGRFDASKLTPPYDFGSEYVDMCRYRKDIDLANMDLIKNYARKIGANGFALDGDGNYTLFYVPEDKLRGV